jgi:putative methyltransferase
MARNAQTLIDLAVQITSGPQSLGIKNQLYASGCPPALLPMLTALVQGVAWSRDQLLACADEEGLLALPPSALPPGCPPLVPPPAELVVVLYEALLGSRRVRGTSPIVELVKAHKASLQQTLAARRKRGAANAYAPALKLPRYLRANNLLISDAQARAHLESLGLRLVPPVLAGPNCLASPERGTFAADPVVAGLFVLPAGTSLHADGAVARGELVLQGRSSCLSALALAPPAGARVIDTCASPGNKTLHCASLMGRGEVVAFERDSARLATLERRVREQAAGHIVAPRGGDFLAADTSASGEFVNVTHVLIDPSCSGSGLVAAREAFSAGEFAAGSGEHDGADGSLAPDSAEVEALARAQEAIILHAMRMPIVEAIVYSTCSVYRRENEEVVLRVLAQCAGRFALGRCLPAWPHRGLDGAEDEPDLRRIAPLVCRATAEADSTDGFFVARFERVGSAAAAAAAPGEGGARPVDAAAAAAGKAERKAARKAARKAERRRRGDASAADDDGVRSAGERKPSEVQATKAKRKEALALETQPHAQSQTAGKRQRPV